MSVRNDSDLPRLPTSEAANILIAHDITPTHQRVEIASILLARDQHMSAEQLLAQVNSGRIVVSKATVYNTLGLFALRGLVREVIVDPAKVFYDSNTGRHHHFYNATSGILSDIEEKDIEISRLPKLPKDTVVDGVDVIVRLRGRES